MLLLSSDRDQINPFLPKRKTDFKTFVNSINWSELDLKEAEEKLTHGTHVTRCLKRGGVPAQVRAQWPFKNLNAANRTQTLTTTKNDISYILLWMFSSFSLYTLLCLFLKISADLCLCFQAFKLKTGYPDAEPYKVPEDSCPRMLSQRTPQTVEASTSVSSGASTSYISITCIVLAIIRQIFTK